MPSDAQLAPQIEQFIHDNPQGVLTSFRRNGMPQLSIVTVYPRDGGVGIHMHQAKPLGLLVRASAGSPSPEQAWGCLVTDNSFVVSVSVCTTEA